MTIDPVESFDPDLLLEASRVMNAAGHEYAKATRLVSDWALKTAPKATPDTRAAIIGDAAALRLRTPGNYEDALKLLKNIDTPDLPDPKGRLHLLRALANGQKYQTETRQKSKNDPDMQALRKSIRDDLAILFSRDDTAQSLNARYWAQPAAVPPDPKSPADKTEAPEDDLYRFYEDDDQFKSMLGAHPDAPAGGVAPDTDLKPKF